MSKSVSEDSAALPSPRCKDCGGILDKYSEPVIDGYCHYCDAKRVEPTEFKCVIGGEIVTMKSRGPLVCVDHGGCELQIVKVALPSPQHDWKEAFRKYGRHLTGCIALDEDAQRFQNRVACDCGFAWYEVRL